MKNFMEKCCDKCWHTPEKPCDLFINCCTKGPLCHESDSCNEKIKDHNDELSFKKHDVPLIFIGMGTCGLAAGAKKS